MLSNPLTTYSHPSGNRMLFAMNNADINIHLYGKVNPTSSTIHKNYFKWMIIDISGKGKTIKLHLKVKQTNKKKKRERGNNKALSKRKQRTPFLRPWGKQHSFKRTQKAASVSESDILD